MIAADVVAEAGVDLAGIVALRLEAEVDPVARLREARRRDADAGKDQCADECERTVHGRSPLKSLRTRVAVRP
jgi:hypothetical protein